ncbi:hypothetical protein [Oceanobacillus bengalensis]|uniref:hypothetical protein n=1 Tax=Oceanobacillus bengalensis TaxID=1435466 RepID=UPI001603681D|nr:hypothetical protein [Oceanobacillus bengalensis]
MNKIDFSFIIAQLNFRKRQESIREQHHLKYFSFPFRYTAITGLYLMINCLYM